MSTINTNMTALANQVRELSGTTTAKGIDVMTSDIDAANAEIAEQANLIVQITNALNGKAAGEGNGFELPTLNTPAAAQDILSGKQAIDGTGDVITGTMPTTTQATPTIAVDTNGLIKASATQEAGYVVQGTKSATKQLTTQSAKTITPTTDEQTAVAKDTYTTGAVKVGPIPSNYIVPNGTKTITENDTYDVTSYASVEVNVAGEDITAETNEYTSLLEELEDAINTLPDIGEIDSVGTTSLTIIHSNIVAEEAYLNKISYYRNGELITVTGPEVEDFDYELSHNLKDNPYFIEAIDINKPIVITAWSSNADIYYSYSTNIVPIYNSPLSYIDTLPRTLVFKIDNASPAQVELEPR